MLYKRLFIAEKPSLAFAIAEEIGIKGKESGCYVCKDDSAVTWEFGHMLEQFLPEEYDPALKVWSPRTLPITPDVWKMKPKEQDGVKKQIKIIKDLSSKSASIINAGDPDREGQLLVDELLEYFQNKKPVQRIWLASLDPKSISNSLRDLKDNQNFLPLKNAALARSRADWLVGFNLTRAMTLSGQRQGLDSGVVLSIGRVQTPTLALVVERDREIENFKAVDYFVPTITIQHPNGLFKGVWVPDELKYSLDPENRLIDLALAQKIIQKLNGQSGNVSSIKNQPKKEPPPLLYNLSTLQKVASSKFGFSAKDTLSITQDLYEGKIITYPRSDCRYLPEEQFDDAKNILNKLQLQGFKDAVNANPKLKSAAWNTKKITAHHGIIPTGVKPAELSENKQKIYQLIVESYLQQFYPAMEYVAQQIITSFGGELWKSTGSVILNPGWTIIGKDAQKEKTTELPSVKPDDDVLCHDIKIENKQTKPPARFTEGTLIEAMASIHKFVKNPDIKKILKETSGIGTDATRVNIIETFFARNYIIKKGKQLISTELGRTVIDVTPKALTDPGTTALWEDFLGQIALGEASMEDFMSQQISLLPQMIKIALEADFPQSLIGKRHECPECKSALKRMKSKKNKKFYWVCFQKERHSNEEVVFLPDDKGKPGQAYVKKDATNSPTAPCPESGCTEVMVLLQSQKNESFYYWKCENKDHPLRFDDKGKPGNIMDFSKKKK